MAEQLYFARHTKVFLEQGSNVWEIPVLEGFSFSQATNATEIVLNEMESVGGVSRRGRKMFNDSYAPAEWSFSTYIRPFIADVPTAEWEDTNANHHAIEEALWANFVAVNAWTPPSAGDSSWTAGVTIGTSDLTFDFDDSNKSILGTFNLWFDLGNCSGDTSQPYKIADCVVNSASIDFDIDGIAMINWSGFGTVITDEASVPAATVTEATLATSNYIRNRLTTLSMTAADTATFPGVSANGVYNAVLTGGNITFENNITFLTPETLCTVNQPIGHVTGSRNIGGSFTAYLNTDTGATADLWEDLIGATDVVTNEFALVFSVGGASAPKVVFNLPQCHLEIPTHSIEDVVAVEVTFAALPSDVTQTDEATIVYTGITHV